MIPRNRPVIGSDLEDIRQELGLSVSDAAHLFGMSLTRWTNVVRKNGNLPVKDNALAMLVLALSAHPEVAPIIRFPEAPAVLDTLNRFADVGKKHFSVLAGSEGSSGYRWTKTGGRLSPVVARLLYIWTQLILQSSNTEDQKDVLNEWESIVAGEATLRGLPDIFKTARWTLRKTGEKQVASSKRTIILPALSRPNKGRRGARPAATKK